MSDGEVFSRAKADNTNELSEALGQNSISTDFGATCAKWQSTQEKKLHAQTSRWLSSGNLGQYSKVRDAVPVQWQLSKLVTRAHDETIYGIESWPPMNITRITLVLIFAAGLSSCGGKVSANPAKTNEVALNCGAHQNDDPAKVCQDFALTGCDRALNCRSGEFRYGSRESCIKTVTAGCLSYLSVLGPAVGLPTIEVGIIWAEGQQPVDCLTPDLPLDDSCYPELHGTLEVGAICMDPRQCKKGLTCKHDDGWCGLCAVAAPAPSNEVEGMTCSADWECHYDRKSDFYCESGACTKKSKIGESCNSHSCDDDAYCDEEGKCSLLKTSGESCEQDQCIAKLRCNDHVCGAIAYPTEGESCSLIERDKFCAFPLACQEGKCAKVGAGAPCQHPNAEGGGCPAGMACGSSPNKAASVCIELAPLGGNCINQYGCEGDMYCSNHKCAFFDLSSCDNYPNPPATIF